MALHEFALISLVIVLYALVSRRTSAWPLTMPMVFVSVGAVTAATGVVEVKADLGAVGVLAEVALAVILFSDAVRIDLRQLRRHALVPTRLLLIGLPLTILLGTGINAALFSSIPLVEVALLAAILSPTDAAVGAAVVEDPSVPLRERLSLNVESGLNDGLVVPVVTTLSALALTGTTSTSEALREVVTKLGVGIPVGAAVGAGASLALAAASSRDWSDGRFEQIATFAVPMGVYALSESLDGSGFLAAFVAGLVFGGVDTKERSEHFAEFTEDAAQLLGIVAFFVFGNLFVGEALGVFTPAVWVCAVATLTVVRMVPVWISQWGSDRQWPTILFLGWFGPRGLASIVFGILLVEEAKAIGESFDDLLGVITVTVTASVFLHGATAAWGARRYGVWAARAELSAEERAEMFMHDMDTSMAPPPRWSRSTWTPGRDRSQRTRDGRMEP